MIDENKLIEYLEGERYLLSDNDGTEKYENEHQYELGNNRIIEKTIKWIKDAIELNNDYVRKINVVYEDIYNQEERSINNAINTLKNLDKNKEKYNELLGL